MGRDPKGFYSHNGKVYGEGMGEGRAVADLDKEVPLKKSVGTAAPNQITKASGEVVDQMNATPLDTGEVTAKGGVVSHEASAVQYTGTIPVPGAAGVPKSEEELEGMSKSELQEEADKRGITVTRQDGDGAPTKADYVAALAKA